jgi:chaperonin cofactor prefoldin
MKEHVESSVLHHLTLANQTIAQLITFKESIDNRLITLENENKILKHKIQQLEEVTNSSYVHLHSVREKQLLN